MLAVVDLLGKVQWSAFAFIGFMGSHTDAYVSIADREGIYSLVRLSCVIPIDTSDSPHSDVSREMRFGWDRNFNEDNEGLLARLVYNNTTPNSYFALDDVRGVSDPRLFQFPSFKVLFLMIKKSFLLTILYSY